MPLSVYRYSTLTDDEGAIDRSIYRSIDGLVSWFVILLIDCLIDYNLNRVACVTYRLSAWAIYHQIPIK